MARSTTTRNASPLSAIMFFAGIILLLVGFFAAAYYASLPLLIGSVGVAIVFFAAAGILARLDDSSPGTVPVRHERATAESKSTSKRPLAPPQPQQPKGRDSHPPPP